MFGCALRFVGSCGRGGSWFCWALFGFLWFVCLAFPSFVVGVLCGSCFWCFCFLVTGVFGDPNLFTILFAPPHPPEPNVKYIGNSGGCWGVAGRGEGGECTNRRLRHLAIKNADAQPLFRLSFSIVFGLFLKYFRISLETCRPRTAGAGVKARCRLDDGQSCHIFVFLEKCGRFSDQGPFRRL